MTANRATTYAAGYDFESDDDQYQQNEQAVLISIDPELTELSAQLRTIRDQQSQLETEFHDRSRALKTASRALELQREVRQNLVTFRSLPDDLRQRVFIRIEAHLEGLRMQRDEPRIVIDERVSRSFNELSSYEGFTLKHSRCGALVCELFDDFFSIPLTSGCPRCRCRDCPDHLIEM